MPYWFEPQSVAIELGGKRLAIETGRMAKQAAGAAVVSYGDSVVLVTVTTAAPREGIDFFPLTVDFVEKTSAAGKIPGGFFKREARLSDREILVCRFIDRSIRPLFAEGFRDEVQVTATVLAHDGKNPPDLAAFVGASAALSLSHIPFLGPIGAVRLGRSEGQWVVNPTHAQQAESDLELVVAGSRDALVMVEGGAKELSEAEILAALQFGHREIQPLIEMQHELVRRAGKPKLQVAVPAAIGGLRERVRAAAEARLRDAVQIRTKAERYAAIGAVEKEVIASFVDAYRKEPVALGSLEAVEARQKGLRQLTAEVKDELHEVRSKLMRERILTDGVRIDGRATKDIRPIACEVRPLPRAHGVALFTRGETQALVYTTLGSSDDAQTIDALHSRSEKHFFLHYNFPPFSVGEVRPLRGPSRRDTGHGHLAERALSAVLPERDDFPYTIRVVSEVLESNGSSSMATVCGGTLALMDAAVPIRRPVAGIAMGLVKEGDQVRILSDILGNEDHEGDMDFKVAGTQLGITALQMDIKIQGITTEIMRQALEQARVGRIKILREMISVLDKPRSKISPYAPRLVTVKISADKIGALIGPGGKTIRRIQEETQTQIEIDDAAGMVMIAGGPKADMDRAVRMVRELTEEVEIGRTYRGKVISVKDFGAFVEILPGQEGLVHVSELAEDYVRNVSEVVKVGDYIEVKVIDIDNQDRIKLSKKAVDRERASRKEGVPATRA